jgi:hypothetical protein
MTAPAKMSAPVKERVRAHRRSLQSLGLQRVELVVPANKVEAIKRYATKLRKSAKKPNKAQITELRSLVHEAFEKYRSSCLDNISVNLGRIGPAEAQVVANALMKRGGSDAFILGRRIARLIAPNDSD